MDNKSTSAYLAQKIYNQPLLVSREFGAVLSRAVRLNISNALHPELTAAMIGQRANPKLDNQNGVAVIKINGLLTYRYDFFMDIFFGNTSYESIRAQFQAALGDPTIKTIAFDIDSPGGEVAGAFDLVDEIYQARGIKPIYAVFNEDGLSAAYAIASAADKRYIARTGSAGSVGIMAMHVDESKLDEKEGIVYTPVYAGSRKIDNLSHAPLSEEARALAQARVDAVYNIFVDTVARNLGVTTAKVRATEAGIYQGKAAIEVGFADQVMSWNQFMAKLTNRKYGGIMKAELENLWRDMSAKFTALLGSDPDVAKDSVSKVDAEKLVATAEGMAREEGRIAGIETGKAEGHTVGRQEGKAESLTRSLAILEICTLAGMEKAAYGYAKDESLDVEAVRAKVIEAQATEAERIRIRSTVGALSTGELNPLIEGAKKAAEAAKAQQIRI